MTATPDISAPILQLFAHEGFTPVNPPIMQPADVFLEKSGEAIRARTYLFADPDGVEELCLRPDLTVPTCRWHLAHAQDPAAEAKYCYLGPVFRYDGPRDDALHPHEFPQAGLEWFGAQDASAADAQVLALAVRAVRAAGLEDFTITIGDVGLVRALLQDIDMPPRWRARLLRRFRRPAAFHTTLNELTGRNGPRERTSISPLIDALAKQPDMSRAMALVEEELDRRGLELVGGRSIEEIAARLLEKAQNRAAEPLPQEKAELIESLLAVSGPLKPAIVHIGRLTEAAGPHLKAAWEAFAARAENIARLLPDEVMSMTFDAGFGRTFDYYTGFVFQLEVDIRGERQPVGGGGRYDDMLASLGGPSVPALGLALHLPRLSAAITAQEEEGAA